MLSCSTAQCNFRLPGQEATSQFQQLQFRKQYHGKKLNLQRGAILGDRKRNARGVEVLATGRPLNALTVAKGRFLSFLHSRHDKDIFGLAIPALLSILLDPIMTLTDTALVGRLGSAQLAAVGLSGITFGFAAITFNFLLFVTTPAIAAAVAQEDPDKASKVTAQGLWVAVSVGIVLAVSVWIGAPFIVTRVLRADPEVAIHAVTYLRCRSVAYPALLAIFVCTGSFRGHKDTRTPLIASVFSSLVNLVLDLFLMFVLGWGVAGAAIATSVSQYISFAILYWKLRVSEKLQWRHLRKKPQRSSIQPMLRSGLALSGRSIVMMGVYVFATTLVASLGAVSLAANEILRQVYIISIQAFTALDISSQALVASYLGRGNRAMARDVLMRVLHLGGTIGVVVGTVIFFTRYQIPWLFTSDSRVHDIATNALILQAFTMPFDAVASVMDGGLIGSSDTQWVAVASFVISSVVYGCLISVKRYAPSFLGFWLCIKLVSLGRIISGTIRYSMPTSRLSAHPKPAKAN